MSPSANVTVLICCKNEAKNIRPCIESVRPFADEVLVADNGSTDGTLEIVARIGGCRIIEREFVNFASFRNWAIERASHPWILILDADETRDTRVGSRDSPRACGDTPAD